MEKHKKSRRQLAFGVTQIRTDEGTLHRRKRNNMPKFNEPDVFSDVVDKYAILILMLKSQLRQDM